jgi:tetratricopeptide (TPR) repeat protein
LAKNEEMRDYEGEMRWKSVSVSPLLLLSMFCLTAQVQAQYAPSEAAKQKLIEGQKDVDAGKYTDALAAYSESIKLAPAYSAAYYRRAIVLYQLRKRTESIADFTKVIELDPRNADAYYRRALSYVSLGGPENYDKFSADLAKALELKPDFLQVYKARATVNAEIGKGDLAIADYTQVLKREPKVAQNYVNRGRTYFNLQTPDSCKLAVADLDQAIALDPQSIRAFALRAQAYALLGRKAEALADCDRIAAISPKGFEAAATRGTIFLNLKDYANAAAQFEKVRSALPENARGHLFAGISYALLHQDDKAIPLLKAGISLGTHDEIRQVREILTEKSKKDSTDRVSDAVEELLQKAVS